ncbi:MAG: ABC transporter substrate-binding protein [Desulfobacteraceae bacterium]|jgi:phospholipid transport system substrate-binding protein
MNKIIPIGFVLAMLVLPAGVSAATPLNTVETSVNQLLSVLGNPALEGEAGRQKKRESIRAISDTLFDFYALSRRTLGPNWKKFNPDQQKEFIALYRKLLESIYMDRLLQYQDEKVKFIKEITLSDTRAEVQSAIVAASGDIPIHYKMYRKDGAWKTYDLIVENVSLVGNYRTQFNSLLSKNSPEKVLEVIREKVKDYL